MEEEAYKIVDHHIQEVEVGRDKDIHQHHLEEAMGEA